MPHIQGMNEDNPKGRIMSALAASGGIMTAAQLEERCKLTKSAVHYFVSELSREEKVWVRKTNAADSGRPCIMVYLAEVISVVPRRHP